MISVCRLFVVVVTVALAVPASAEPFQHVHTFRSTTVDDNDRTGRRVALSSDYALVASPDARDGITKFYDLATKDLAFAVPPPKRGRDGRYGSRFAVDGHHALICGHGYKRKPETHRAILFDLKTATSVRRFNEPGTGINSDFARSCALSVRHALVGARSFGQRREGVAYLFDVASGDLVRTFHPPAPQRGGAFGNEVALWGQYAAITAGAVRRSLLDEGAVHLFDVETGELLQMLHPELHSRSRVLGIAMAAGRILVGTTRALGRGRTVASALLFDMETGELLHRLAPPPDMNADAFGGTVALTGRYALVGAPMVRDAGDTFHGAAFLYDIETGRLVQTITRPEKVPGLFGVSVAMTEDHILIGLSRDSLLNSGAAYLFRAAEE